MISPYISKVLNVDDSDRREVLGRHGTLREYLAMAEEDIRDDETPAATEDTSTSGPGAAAGRSPGASVEPTSDIKAEDVKVPEFASMKEGLGRGSSGGLDRFYDVHVPIWAELGRVELPLGELVRLSEGAVVRLERPISEPVDVVSQGVKLARGEVIVIDDCFAIRIKEIIASK